MRFFTLAPAATLWQRFKGRQIGVPNSHELCRCSVFLWGVRCERTSRMQRAAAVLALCAAAVLLAAAGYEGNGASSAQTLLDSDDDAPWSRPVGKGDYWLAKEDSMELDAADALARRYALPSTRTAPAMRGSGGAQPVGRERHVLPPCEHALRCFSDRSGAAGLSGEASRSCTRAAAGGEPLIGGSATACEACGSRARPPSSGWLRTTTEHRLSAAGRTCCGCRCVCVCVRVYLCV